MDSDVLQHRGHSEAEDELVHERQRAFEQADHDQRFPGSQHFAIVLGEFLTNLRRTLKQVCLCEEDLLHKRRDIGRGPCEESRASPLAASVTTLRLALARHDCARHADAQADSGCFGVPPARPANY